jgi:hypothetical protein
VSFHPLELAGRSGCARCPVTAAWAACTPGPARTGVLASNAHPAGVTTIAAMAAEAHVPHAVAAIAAVAAHGLSSPVIIRVTADAAVSAVRAVSSVGPISASGVARAAGASVEETTDLCVASGTTFTSVTGSGAAPVAANGVAGTGVVSLATHTAIGTGTAIAAYGISATPGQGTAAVTPGGSGTSNAPGRGTGGAAGTRSVWGRVADKPAAAITAVAAAPDTAAGLLLFSGHCGGRRAARVHLPTHFASEPVGGCTLAA